MSDHDNAGFDHDTASDMGNPTTGDGQTTAVSSPAGDGSLTASRGLAAELSRIRGETPGASGRRIGMRPFATRLGLGAKSQSSVSDYERGHRIPVDDVIAKYKELPASEPGRLDALVADARLEATRALSAAPESPAGMVIGWRHRRTFLVLTAGVIVAAVISGGVWIWRDLDDSARPSTVTISAPAGTVGVTTELIGDATGLNNQDLWVDVQTADDPVHHHPAEQPCVITPDGRFTFSPLYIGAPDDHGKHFHISVIEVTRDGAAEHVLQTYAHRDKVAPDAYAGLSALPDGSTVVAEQDVTRS